MAYPTGAGGYGQPAPGYGQPAPGYGQPAPGYGQPAPGYGQPAPGYSQPAPGFGQPAPAFVQPQFAADPQVMAWFQAVDADRSGRIGAVELQQALTNSDWSRFSINTVYLLIDMFDRDRSGQIDLNEFQQLWGFIQQWKATFDGFDRDRSGSIDKNELANAMTQMGYRLSPRFLDLVVYKFDPIHRCRVSLDFFIAVCATLQTFTGDFRARDQTGSGFIRLQYDDFMCMGAQHKP